MHRVTELLADRLVLVFTFSMSLKSWRDTGMLDRELALYRALAPSYATITLATYGDAEDQRILRDALPEDLRERFTVVCNDAGQTVIEFADALPQKVVDAVGADKSIVVKTNQMMGGEAAVRITQALRQAGKQVGLIARGGYLWTRFVTHEHGPHSEAANDAAAREKVLCQAADMVVGTTPDMIEDLSWRYGLNPAQTRVIPNFILTDRNPTEACEREKGLILYAGQLVPRKRVEVLIDAMTHLPDEYKPLLTLEIVGDGPERRNLMERAKRFGASVTFKSRLPHHELVERMHRCMVYAQASDLEGHPKTVIEAMGTGAAVIVADSPGLGLVVDHGSTGLRVPPDSEAFATAFGEMCNDLDWRDMLGATAARVTRARYALDAIVPLELDAHRLALSIGSSKTSLRAAG
jgi:hypothetical protein